MIFKYYGVDWFIFVLLVLHLWLLGEQKRYAFLIGAVATLFGLIDSVATIVMNVVFCMMHLLAYAKWKGKDDA